jgi:hypothetical protein
MVSAFTFRTKATGIWANFTVDCGCGGELTVTNGRPAPHTCERIAGTLDEVLAALDNR